MRIASFLGRSSLGIASPCGPRLFAAGTFAAIIVALGPGSGQVALPESTSTPATTTPAPARQPIAAVRPEAVKPTEYHLVYKFLLNQDVHMPLSVDSHIQVQKDQAVTNTMNQSTVERHYHVDSVDPDGSAIVELFIDNVKLTYAFNNGKPITYDTSKKELPPRGFEGVNRSLGMHGRVRFSPQGNVLPLPGLPNDASTDPSESFLDSAAIQADPCRRGVVRGLQSQSVGEPQPEPENYAAASVHAGVGRRQDRDDSFADVGNYAGRGCPDPCATGAADARGEDHVRSRARSDRLPRSHLFPHRKRRDGCGEPNRRDDSLERMFALATVPVAVGVLDLRPIDASLDTLHGPL